ncbi:MAG TPA: GTPase [Streptosporangiaceae bacterium]
MTSSTPEDPSQPAPVTFRPLGAVIDAVVALADQAMLTVTGPTQAELTRIRDALREPVRIAVAGRVNAGKSTLVNALVGQVVAPTDVSECTRLVTWYRYGSPQRLEIVMRDGSRRRERLGSGASLPATLGIEHDQVRCLEVWLANDTLRSMTLIDTPGLGSLNADYSTATEELLAMGHASAEAIATADALVYIFNNDVRPDEVAALRSFRESSGGLGGAAGNAIGVLSKADKIGSGPDWWDAAERKAKQLAEQLGDDIVSMLPLVGLTAQTAEGAQLTEPDAQHLADLAVMAEEDLELLLISGQRFIAGSEARGRLLKLLELQGITTTIELIREGITGAAPLRAELAERSGIGALRTVINETFRGKGERLKIRSALQAIERLCSVPDTDPDATPLRAVADQSERLQLSPLLHQLAEAEALALSVAGVVPLPDELAADVRRIGSGLTPAEQLGVPGGDPAALRGAALAGSARWRAALVASSPAQARLAQVIRRSYTLAYQEVQA